MSDIKDVINELNIDDLAYQLLMQGNTKLALKGRKDKYLQVTFETNAEFMGQDKEAIILWVDRPKLQEAYERVKTSEKGKDCQKQSAKTDLSAEEALIKLARHCGVELKYETWSDVANAIIEKGKIVCQE